MVTTNRKEDDTIEELKVGRQKMGSMKTFLSRPFLNPVTLAHSLVPSKRKEMKGINLAAMECQAASVRTSLE